MKLFAFLISVFLPIKSEEQCGITEINSGGPSGLIFNGQLAQDEQWPWAAALYLDDGEERIFFCSGTLISSQSVLTGKYK